MNSYMRRRSLLKTCAGLAGASALTRFQALAAAEKGRTKIRDIKVMMVQGGRTYTYIKIDTDAGVSGIGEGYGNPGVGVKEGVLDMRPSSSARILWMSRPCITGRPTAPTAPPTCCCAP